MKQLVTLLLLCVVPFAAWAQSASPDPVAAKTLWEGPPPFCKNCHGMNGEGGFGPDLAGRGLSVSEFQHAVRKPWGVMPAFTEAQLSDAEIAGLAAYFASLPKVPQAGDWRVQSTADLPHGQQVYISEIGRAHV